MQPELAAALHQLTRKLHNYLAAAGSLIDHTRRFSQKWYPSGTESRRAVASAIAARFHVGERLVVQDLRDYTLHYEVPIIRAVHGETDAEGTPAFLRLDTSELLKWDGWKARSRFALRAAAELDLAALIVGYTGAVEDLYHWFDEWVRRTHADALAEHNALQAQHEQLLRDFGLGAALDAIHHFEEDPWHTGR